MSQQPVAGEKIAMTAPVTQTPKAGSDGHGNYVFSFLMPARYTRETLPQPLDPRVRIREIPAKLVAARRYSGTWSEAHYREQEIHPAPGRRSGHVRDGRRAGLCSLQLAIFAVAPAPQ